MDVDSMIINEWFDLHIAYCDSVIKLLKKGQGFILTTEDHMSMLVELAYIASEEIGAKGVVVCGNSPWFVKLVF